MRNLRHFSLDEGQHQVAFEPLASAWLNYVVPLEGEVAQQVVVGEVGDDHCPCGSCRVCLRSHTHTLLQTAAAWSLQMGSPRMAQCCLPLDLQGDSPTF